MTRIFLDTNVLYGALSCDLFLSLAEYEPLGINVGWSDYVLDELRKHLTRRLLRIRPEEGSVRAEERAAKRIDAMTGAFPHAYVTGWRSYMGGLREFVSDPDDAPILAGALAFEADVLATSNVKDFRIHDIAKRYGLEVERPGAVLEHLLSGNGKVFRAGLERMLHRNHLPPRNMTELSEMLGEMPEFESLSRRLNPSRRPSFHPVPSAGGYQPRDSRGRFARKIGGYGYDGDLADPDGWC